MDERTAARLAEINARFYEDNADSFVQMRQHPWRGWARLIAGEPAARVLDVGCGHGRFLTFLEDRGAAPKTYVGLDSSTALLARARQRHPSARFVTTDVIGDDDEALGERHPSARCVAADVNGADYEALGERHPSARFVTTDVIGDDDEALGERHPSARFVAADVIGADYEALGEFDLVVAFGLLHHIPTEAARAELVRALAGRVAPGGRLVLALWKVDAKIRARAWTETDVDASELEPTDHLLGWGPNPSALRYCHEVDAHEAARLVQATGLTVLDDYVDDGPRSDSNRYLILGR